MNGIEISSKIQMILITKSKNYLCTLFALKCKDDNAQVVYKLFQSILFHEESSLNLTGDFNSIHVLIKKVIYYNLTAAIAFQQ